MARPPRLDRRVAPGYAGTLASIAKRLGDEEPALGWIPTPLPTESPEQAPLSIAELGELRRLLANAGPDWARMVTRDLPPVDRFPSADEVRSWIAAEVAATRRARETANAISSELVVLPIERRNWLETSLRATHLARDQGLAVGERGRLHPIVIQAWNKAHPERPFR